MAVVLTGTKTVTHGLAPHLPAAMLTTLLATPLENLTVGQIEQICDAIKRIPDGDNPLHTIGSLLI
jgi:hypothetical protein